MAFRAGVVGCGRIGSEFDEDPKRKTISTHAGAYSAVDGVELVALSDLDENKLGKSGRKWGITSLYPDYKDMVRKENLDILSVCTWNSTHLEIVREAIDNGVKAIFCEKPIANTLRDADEMIKLCHQKHVILQIDHQRRFEKFHQEVRDFLRNGNLGRIQQANFYYVSGIANSGSHMFDLLRFFFGEVDWIRGIYSQNESPNPKDPNIDGIVKFRDGTFCAVQACDVRDFYIFELDSIGTKGRLNITHAGFDLEFYEASESKLSSEYRELNSSEPPFSSKDSPREFMVSGVEHLIECLGKGKKAISSGEDGRASLELICAFQKSAENDGEKIMLPLKDSDVRVESK